MYDHSDLLMTTWADMTQPATLNLEWWDFHLYLCSLSSGWIQRWIFLLFRQCPLPEDLLFPVQKYSNRGVLCAEIFKLVFFVQNYSNQGVSCRNIQIRVFRAEILVRYRHALPSHARLTIWIVPNQTRLSQKILDSDFQTSPENGTKSMHYIIRGKFVISPCRKNCLILDPCSNITFSCRNITMWPAFTPTFLCRAIFRGCAEIFIFRRHIHLWHIIREHYQIWRFLYPWKRCYDLCWK